MPADDGLGLDDEEGVFPARPEARHCHPQRAVDRGEVRARVLLRIDCQLLAKGQLDEHLVAPTPEEGGERCEYDRDVSEDASDHLAILPEAAVQVESES